MYLINISAQNILIWIFLHKKPNLEYFCTRKEKWLLKKGPFCPRNAPLRVPKGRIHTMCLAQKIKFVILVEGLILRNAFAFATFGCSCIVLHSSSSHFGRYLNSNRHLIPGLSCNYCTTCHWLQLAGEFYLSRSSRLPPYIAPMSSQTQQLSRGEDKLYI